MVVSPFTGLIAMGPVAHGFEDRMALKCRNYSPAPKRGVKQPIRREQAQVCEPTLGAPRLSAGDSSFYILSRGVFRQSHVYVA